MKASKTIIVTLYLVVFLSCGFASAVTLTSDQASVRALVSNPEPQAGDTITVMIFFQNNYTESLVLDYVGLHFGWMPESGFYGFNLSSSPVTVASGSDYFFPQSINVKIPAGVNGIQSYYAGVEGTVGSSTTDTFSINSETAEILVSGNGSTTTPTNTPSTGQPSSNILLYGVIIVVVVVVALLIVIMILRKKRKQPEQTEKPAETQKPAQEPSEQDFSI